MSLQKLINYIVEEETLKRSDHNGFDIYLQLSNLFYKEFIREMNNYISYKHLNFEDEYYLTGKITYNVGLASVKISKSDKNCFLMESYLMKLIKDDKINY